MTPGETDTCSFQKNPGPQTPFPYRWEKGYWLSRTLQPMGWGPLAGKPAIQPPQAKGKEKTEKEEPLKYPRLFKGWRSALNLTKKE